MCSSSVSMSRCIAWRLVGAPFSLFKLNPYLQLSRCSVHCSNHMMLASWATLIQDVTFFKIRQAAWIVKTTIVCIGLSSETLIVMMWAESITCHAFCYLNHTCCDMLHTCSTLRLSVCHQLSSSYPDSRTSRAIIGFILETGIDTHPRWAWEWNMSVVEDTEVICGVEHPHVSSGA